MEFTACGPAERAELTAFLSEAPGGDVLQTPAWADLKSRTGWAGRHYVVRQGGRVRAAVTVLCRSLPLLKGCRIGYAPRGPVADDPAALDELLRGLGRQARAERLVFLKVDPAVPAPAPDFTAALTRAGFSPVRRGPGFEGVQPRFVMRLALDRSEDEVMAGFSPKTRYNVRLAARKGVAVREETGPEDLVQFYELLEETARRDGFAIRSFRYYQDLWECLVEPGLARLFVAEYEGKPLAGAILFHLGETAWYVYGASSGRRRELMPNHALQWAMIRWAMRQGCTVYDFRGVSGDLDPVNPLYGLYRFKKGFGAALVEYVGEYDLVCRPLLHRAYVYLEPACRRLRSRSGRRTEAPE